MLAPIFSMTRLTKFYLLPIFILIGVESCSYEYLSQQDRKAFHRNYHSKSTINQTRQLRKKDYNFSRDSAGVIYIQAITARRKDKVGIYGYNSYSTHFGNVNFFFYKNNEIIILNRTNLDSLQATIATFLNNNNFSKRQIVKTKNKVLKTWNLHSTDSF
jgi:hypothetical protein